MSRYLNENLVRVHDIELLTGFVFMTGLMDERQRRHLVTNLATELWRVPSWMDLADSEAVVGQAECPPG